MEQQLKNLLFFVGLLLFAKFGYSQIQAPHLLCISNDTLVWDLPNNTCGGFNGYLIYSSTTEQGPFTLLTTITDQGQTNYFDPTGMGSTQFYYMESDFDCPGVNRLQSDTLDNLIPEISPINFVSINEMGNVIVNWTPSPSPEVTAYLIYRRTTMGTVIIDTVFNGTIYEDQGASINSQSETYFVNAIDPCGNTSIFIEPHNTIFLEATSISECDQSITLEWNLYQNWPTGIDRQEILVSINGGDFFVLNSVDGMATSFVFDQLNDSDEYCFLVRAVNDGLGFSSNSNTICQTVDIVQPATDLVITNVSVTNNNAVDITWNWGVESELTSYQILRAPLNGAFEPFFGENLSGGLSQSNTVTDSDDLAFQGPVRYRVVTTDACDTLATSNTVTSIFLTAIAEQNGQNQLSWTPYQNESANVNSYEIHRISNGMDEVIGAVSGTELNFSDLVDVSVPGQANPCYYVVAIADLWLPDGTRVNTESLSNQACVTQQASVFVPNAFVPDGVNNIFKPILQFGAPTEYTMLIYDRWGGQVFESANIDTGWNGNSTNGKALPQGIYAYYIKVNQGGNMTEVSGTVLLLR